MRRRFWFFVALAASLTQLPEIGAFAPPPVVAEESPPGSDKANAAATIEVSRCRIKLIDRVLLAADVTGIIRAIPYREGAAVEAGAVVVHLKDDVPQAQLAIVAKEAENDIDIRYARKAAELAQAELEKAELANQRVAGAIPDVEVRRLRLAAERSVLQIEQAEHTLAINRLKRDEAAAQLATHRIHAPFAGVVTRLLKGEGEAVRQGDPVIELVSTDRVRIEGEVPIAQALTLKAGMPLEVRLEIPDAELEVEQQTFPGRLVFVDVVAEPVTQQVRIWGEVDNPHNLLRAGLSARMQISLSKPPTPP